MRTSTIYFYGGVESVTGSNFLLDTGGSKFLIDCGLFQGMRTAEDTNWTSLPYEPKTIPFLIITHAHIDHIGRIPKLVRDGFRGKIYSTEATKALAEPLLYDAMELLQHEAEWRKLEPMYEEKDITQSMQLWDGLPYHKSVELADDFSFEFLDSGHILGSAMVRLTREGRSIIFTGDLGGGNSPLVPPTESPTGAEYLVMESVYGDRLHDETEEKRNTLENCIEDTFARGGTLLIPAFAAERTQDLLYEIRTLMVEKRVPSMPVYLDSPLADKITAAYLAYPQYFNDEMQKRIASGEHIFEFPELKFVKDASESRRIGEMPGPKIILAGSGMSNGGRIISHEKEIFADERSMILIVGYQSAGSLGRRLVDGAKVVQIRGEDMPVKCHVSAIYGYSAHMDSEQLLEFVNKMSDSLQEVFVVMGEPASSGFLAQRIRDYIGVRAITPESNSTAKIDL